MTTTAADVLALLTACVNNDFRTSWPVLLDLVEEEGWVRSTGWFDRMRRVKKKNTVAICEVEKLLLANRVIARDDAPWHRLAVAFEEKMFAISLDRVPVNRNPRAEREEQARLARALFRQLGLAEVRVRVPRYSMATVVDILFPATYLTGTEYSFRRNRVYMTMQAVLDVGLPNYQEIRSRYDDYVRSFWHIESY